VLQCVAVCCSALQCIALHQIGVGERFGSLIHIQGSFRMQCVAVCCSVLQCVAVRCSSLGCVGECSDSQIYI